MRKSIIKTENQLMMFSNSIWPDCLYTDISTGGFFYQGGSIDHYTHVPGPVDQSSAESEYNAACTAIMSLAHFRTINSKFLKNYPDLVP